MYAVIWRDTTTFDGFAGRVQSLHQTFDAAQEAIDKRQQKVVGDGPGRQNYLPLKAVELHKGVQPKVGEWLWDVDIDRSSVVGGSSV